MNHCEQCDKNLSRLMFCCDKCRVKYFRQKHKAVIVTKENVIQIVKKIPVKSDWDDVKKNCSFL